jgi:prepilin-type processing-associated H-X9-DG protein
MPSIQESEPSISKFVENSTAPMPGDEKLVYVLIGTPPPPEQTGSTFQRGSLAEDGMDAGGSQSHGDDLLGGVVAAQNDYAATPVELTARPHYFDGKFLVDRDLIREQASSSGASESRSAPSVSEVVVTKQNDSAHETPFYLHLKSIDIEATASPTSGDDILIGGATSHDGGINMLLGDGSVRDISPRDAAFFAYDPGFLGGVVVSAADSSDPLDAVVFAADRYDPLQEQGIGGISIAVADIEGKGPHMLMTAAFMLG